MNSLTLSTVWLLTTRFCASIQLPGSGLSFFAHKMCSPNLEDSFIDWSADAESYFCSAKSTTSAYSRSENPALPAEIPHLWLTCSIMSVTAQNRVGARTQPAYTGDNHESRTKLLSAGLTRADLPLYKSSINFKNVGGRPFPFRASQRTARWTLR